MNFRMILPEGKVYVHNTDSIIIPLTDGLAGIKKGHSPVLAELADGIITVKSVENGKETIQYRIKNALIEVLDDKITVLTDQVEVLPQDSNKTLIR